LREVIAEELVKIDDERLDLVTVTAIDVDSEMNRAIVYFDSMFGEEGDEGVLEAMGEHRARLQATINRQMHARKTPILSFRPDEVIRSAARIEELLRQQPPRTSQSDDTDDSQPEQ
jgi:ribosome-binding factor A